MPDPPSPSGLAATSRRVLRILYADDVDDLRVLARLSFSRAGHSIECVADGEAAYDRVVADRGFDLVITDHHMPIVNGLELVMRLRAIDYPGRIIVVSSEIEPSVDAEYRRLHVDGILYKPVYPAMVHKLLADLFPVAASA